MFDPGEVISYQEMCLEEGVSLQRGMNFRARPGHSVVLMSRRRDAPYRDRIEADGRTLIYEGHDAPRSAGAGSPKSVDQPERRETGSLTQNGAFARAAREFRSGKSPAERVRVYEKLHEGIWVFNGVFQLVDAW